MKNNNFGYQELYLLSQKDCLLKYLIQSDGFEKMTRIKSNDKSHDRGFYLEFDSYENRNKAYNTYLKRSSDTHHRKSGGCNIKLVGDVWVQACEMFLESNEKTTLSDFQTVKDTSLYLLYDYQKGIEEEKAEKSINSNEC